MRVPSIIEMRFFETYYYANVIHNVLSDPSPYIRNLNDWHEDSEETLFFQSFPKTSVLHNFAAFIIEDLLFERIDEPEILRIKSTTDSKAWIDDALLHHGFQSDGFFQWLSEQGIHSLDEATVDNLYDYHIELRLSGELDQLIEHLSNEVFFLLFGNRMLLANLNAYVAGIVSHFNRGEMSADANSKFEKDGVLARCHVPEWAKRAVYHRDRGRCTNCRHDLTGLISIEITKNFDHIIPLAEGGINDVTNLQLLCERCNLLKGSDAIAPSTTYESWYT